MSKLFSNTLHFSVLFFSILLVDIIVKSVTDVHYYRFITKTPIMVSLIAYYLINQKEKMNKRLIFMSLALIFFLLGDFFLLMYKNFILYIIGMSFFVLGKLFYALRFSNQKDFKLYMLFPFLMLSFAFMVFLMNLIYDRLGDFFVPVMVYLFACLMVALFAFLRKGEVNFSSYVLVVLGIVFTIFSDTISVLQEFYRSDIAYHKITIMLFYGISQYFIVIGIVREYNDDVFVRKVNAS